MPSWNGLVGNGVSEYVRRTHQVTYCSCTSTSCAVSEKNEGWQKIRDAYDEARRQIEESDADLIIIYSTLWPSVIGHQIQARSKSGMGDGRRRLPRLRKHSLFFENRY